MPLRPSWLLAAASIGMAGFMFVKSSYESTPDRIDRTSTPGVDTIYYRQNNPQVGLFGGIAIAAGVTGCLWQATKEEEGEVQQPSGQRQVASPVREVRQIERKQKIEVDSDFTPDQYDEDPEIELEEVQQPSKEPEKKPQNQSKLFDRMLSNRKRHLLIPAETGAGKTTLLLGAIEYFHEQLNGNAEFFLSTAKPSPCLGLEEQKGEDGLPRVINVSIDEPDTILPLIQRLKWLRKRMVARQHQRVQAEQTGGKYNPKRNIIILDEWNVTLAVAHEYDRIENSRPIEKGEPKITSHIKNDLIALVEGFLLMGREDEMAVWLFGQDHQVQNASINTGYQKSFGIVVPGMDGSMQGIEQALIGRSPVVPVAKGKVILQEAEQVAAENPEVAIAYCNINGHEVLVSPYLPGIKRKRIFSKHSNVVNLRPNQKQQLAVVNSAPVELEEDPWND